MLFELLSDIIEVDDVLLITKNSGAICEIRSNFLTIRQKEKWITLGDNDGPAHMHVNSEIITSAEFIQTGTEWSVGCDDHFIYFVKRVKNWIHTKSTASMKKIISRKAPTRFLSICRLRIRYTWPLSIRKLRIRSTRPWASKITKLERESNFCCYGQICPSWGIFLTCINGEPEYSSAYLRI